MQIGSEHRGRVGNPRDRTPRGIGRSLAAIHAQCQPEYHKRGRDTGNDRCEAKPSRMHDRSVIRCIAAAEVAVSEMIVKRRL